MAMPVGHALKIFLDHPMMKGAVKYAVNKACEPTMDAIYSTRNMSEAQRKEVVDIVCRSLDIVLEKTIEEDVNPVKGGLYLLHGGITVRNLTQSQQDLCQKSLINFALNGADLIIEGFDTAEDIKTYGGIAEAVEPAGGALFGGAAAISLHAADLYQKAGKVVNAAYDVHCQSGDLAFDKTTKTRDPEVSPTALACYPEDGGLPWDTPTENQSRMP